MDLEKVVLKKKKKAKVLALSQLQDTYYSLVLVYRHSSTSPSMPRTLCQYIPSARKGTCGAHTLHFNLHYHLHMNRALFTILHIQKLFTLPDWTGVEPCLWKATPHQPPAWILSFSYHQDSFILIEVRQYYRASATTKRKKKKKEVKTTAMKQAENLY